MRVNPKEALALDENQLDQEWIAQPKLYYDYAALVASVTRELDELKNALEVTKAEIAQKIRSNPDAYGISKFSESALEKVVPLQQEVIGKQQELVECREKLDLAKAVVSALDHKKKALEKLVELIAMNYYARPRANTDASREVERRGVRRGRRRE